MKQILLTGILVLFVLSKASACLNGESKLLKDGTFLYEDQEGNVPLGHIFESPEYYKIVVEKLDSLYRATKDVDYLSDKGLLLILLKRYEEAIELYLKIERLEPNRYSTASNLGTAYELYGEESLALRWIQRAVELDPASHQNSEWIHVKILEAKIKGEEFYTTRFLLNTDFGSGIIPASTLTKPELEKLSEALFFQLNERVSFIQPKEKIVAQLLFDLGNAAFQLGNYFDARDDYEQAKLYGFSDQLIDMRIKEINRRVDPTTNLKVVTPPDHTLSYMGLLATIVLVTLGVVVYRWRKGKSSA